MTINVFTRPVGGVLENDIRGNDNALRDGINVRVVGPASSTNNAVVRWDGATGLLVQDSVVVIGDTGAVTGITTVVTTGDTSLAQAAATANVYVGSGSGSATSNLIVRSAASQYVQVGLFTGTLARWYLYKDIDAESGANAGATLRIGARADDGSFIDNPISITRAASGNITLARPLVATSVTLSSTLTQNAATANLAQSTANAVVNVGSGAGSGSSGVWTRSVAGQSAGFVIATGATTARWNLSKTTGAESGSNAGSDLQLLAYDDSGSSLGAVLSVVRAANGMVTFSRPFTADVGTGLFRIENGSTVEFELNGNTGQVGVGAAAEADVGVLLDTPARAITANTDYERLYVRATGNVTVTNGTTSFVVATARFDEPRIVLAGTGTATIGATVYIPNAPTEATFNAALYIASGLTAVQSLSTTQLLIEDSTASGVGLTGVTDSGGAVTFTAVGPTPSITFATATRTNNAVLSVEGTGRLSCRASTTSSASVRIAHGAAPTSPVDGDMWTTTAGLFVRINGATIGPLS